jgi:hypothetical protein
MLTFIKKDKRTYYAHEVKKRGRTVGWIQRCGGKTGFEPCDLTPWDSSLRPLFFSLKNLREIADFIDSLKKGKVYGKSLGI